MTQRLLLAVTWCVGAMVAACGSDNHARQDASPPIDAPLADSPVDAAPLDAPADATADAPADGPLDSASCNSGSAFGSCGSGNKCTWIVDADDPTANDCAGANLGHVGCAPLGTKQLGSACGFDACNDGGTVGSDGTCADGKPAIGVDDCGLDPNGNYMFCISHRCETVCDVNGGTPACDADHACSEYENIYGNASSAIAGVCDERCDPVSQRTLDGSAEACRSPDVAQTGAGSAERYPELGCYEDDNADENTRLVDFTCSDSPFGRQPTTVPPQCGLAPVTAPAEDRDDCDDLDGCAVAVSGEEFPIPNGCAPGYVNLLVASSQPGAAIICSAYCAPLDTDTTQPANAVGDATALGKDVTDAAAIAGRATCKTRAAGGKAAQVGETCIYGWQFAIDPNTAQLPATAGPRDIDHIGVCFADADYDYDPTGGANPTKPDPSCATLLPGFAGDDASCAGSGNDCGTGAICIGGACHVVTTACGSGSGKDADGDDTPGNEADCFALFHGCYDSVEEGVAAPGSGSARVRTHARPRLSGAIVGRARAIEIVHDRAAFRRPHGIH